MQLGSLLFRGAGIVLALCTVSAAIAQPPDFGGRGFGGGGFGGGFGGPGGAVRSWTARQTAAQFDKDGKGYLNSAERKAAREYLATQPRRGRGGFGGGRGFGGPQTSARAGGQLKPGAVKSYGNESLYDLQTLRTLFLEFEDPDWEKELADFYHTDVDVPAKLTVDGKVYPDVGVHFRGQSSYSTVPEGRKRSSTVSAYGARGPAARRIPVSNLLNSNADPTFLRTALYQYVARQYIAAPKANWVRVAINGESWGVYVNTQQINSEFTQEWFQSTKGADGRCLAALGHAVAWGTWATIPRLIRALRNQDERRPEVVGRADQPLQGAEPDSAGRTGKGAGADPGCGRRAEVPGAGQGCDQQ